MRPMPGDRTATTRACTSRPVGSRDRDHPRAGPAQALAAVGAAAVPAGRRLQRGGGRGHGVQRRAVAPVRRSSSASPRSRAAGGRPRLGPGLWEALRPYALADANGYINSISEYSGDEIRGSYGNAKYQRLTGSKPNTTQTTRSTSTRTSRPADAFQAGEWSAWLNAS